jgi:hypothetical protein
VKGKKALDAERRLMNESLTRLAKTEIRRKEQQRPVGRLIFALDLTQSRGWSLKQARIATAKMFDAAGTIGRIAIKLIYFRGTSECRETAWHENPDPLCASMMKLSCKTGITQIGCVLRRALNENEKLSAVVYVGDYCEEEAGELLPLAQRLGARQVPLFIFQENGGNGTDNDFAYARSIFRGLAEASGGVHLEFRPDSGNVLRELLSGIAAFSANGIEGVERLALPTTSEAKELRGRLLLALGNGK